MAGKRVVTIGGVTAERVLVVEHERFRPGGKHTLPPGRLMAGGSAVNHASRLLATGTEALPIGPLCRDAAADLVMETLAEAARRGGCSVPDREQMLLSGTDLTTPFTTIVSVGEQRTLYTEFSERVFEPFESHLIQRLADLDPDRAGAVMVGHIHADRAEPPGRAGAITEHVVSTFAGHGVPVFANFGAAQYRQGCDRWLGVLRDIDCFQLDIGEVRTFVAEQLGGGPSLHEILSWFSDKCTVLITLERMGAVGRCKGSDQLVLTWPYEIEPVDTTGAGDAFGAGVVSSLLEHGIRSDGDLRAAMDRGGLFAAYACGHRGGADHPPTMDELEAFRACNTRVLDTEVTPFEHARRLLTLLDRAFPARG